MMVLHPAGNSEQAPGRATMQKPALRRRRSKGTIAAFAFGISSDGAGAAAEPLGGNDVSETLPIPQGAANSSSSPSQPLHTVDSIEGPPKPCVSARLALMCAQNAIHMGARTQLYLCPPGRARRELQSQLRQRVRAQQSQAGRRVVGAPEAGGYYGLEKMLGADSLEDYEAEEEDFLISTNTFNVDSDEEPSSGDEDELDNVDELFSEEPISIDEDRYSNLTEPLFTPAGAEANLSNPNGAPVAAVSSVVPGKLPFNRRKIRYFDTISASDSYMARTYIREELRKSKRKVGLMLSRHVRRLQREELRRRYHEAGESTDDLSESDNEDAEKKSLSNGGVTRLSGPMTPALSAALLIESLCANPVESIEGMARCYDGIVDAGVALLDSQVIDPTKPASEDSRVRATRSQIMSALAPLLITSLEQPSGEVILLLAKLRRMCGTPRYQRRFVQRVAPCLIRPERSAMWSLRHQNDMEAILAAAELIFDSAFELFGKGWYERGRLLLADSKRAETLNAAATQLRNLSSEQHDGLVRGLTGGKRKRVLNPKVKKQEGSPGEPLAEWEVIAVDRQIRVSISNVLAKDWSRTASQQDVPKPAFRRGAPTSKRPATLPQTPSTDMSPKSIQSSPRGQIPPVHIAKTPNSPPHMPSVASLSSAPDAMENVFGPSFASQIVNVPDRAESPTPSGITSDSSVLGQRKGSIENETKAPDLPSSTPPRSPRSPHKTEFDASKLSESTASTRMPLSPRVAPISPKQGMSRVKEFPLDSIRPSSPSSIGTSVSHEALAARATSSMASSTVSTPLVMPPSSQYRNLTSTAAERKRTVAACRALRAQIQRFEDAFIQLHGRPPKGATERAPLATTYAQYREWKRAIRADAACRIQALFRGARTRWTMLRSSNPILTRVVLRRAGRPGERALDLSIPADIGQHEHENVRGPLAASPGPSIFPRHSGTHTLSPQWGNTQMRHKPAMAEGGEFDSLSPTSLVAIPSASPTRAAIGSSDVVNLSLVELQNRKRDLKQQLKQYDITFARRHGRMPVKAEKEPIRHLYESYNALKNQISMLEQEGRLTNSPMAASTPTMQRTVSPTSGSESGHSVDDSPVRMSPNPARSKRKVPKAASPPMATTPLVPVASSSMVQDLASLKAEKSQLHQMLRSYEKDFFKEHKRQVSSFADIKPVASQYRRYKEIKKAIATLQQQQQEK